MQMAYYQNRQGGIPKWVIKWLINALALLIVSYVPYRGRTLIQIDGAGAALIAAAVLGIVNTLSLIHIWPFQYLQVLPAHCGAEEFCRGVHQEQGQYQGSREGAWNLLSDSSK